HSRARREALSSWPQSFGRGPFAWVAPPVLNPFTRVAVEMCAAKGTLRAIGYELGPGGALPQPGTQVWEWSAGSLGASGPGKLRHLGAGGRLLLLSGEQRGWELGRISTLLRLTRMLRTRSEIRFHNPTIEMPGRMAKYRHHDCQAEEKWQRAYQQQHGHDKPPGRHGDGVGSDGAK